MRAIPAARARRGNTGKEVMAYTITIVGGCGHVGLPQIVSGSSPAALNRAKALFRLLTNDVVELPPIEAELAKLFANTYRYINFAISNQLYLIARKFDADF